MTSPHILIVGEAYGQHEAALGHPFVGPAGRQLLSMLSDVDIFPRGRIPYEPAELRDFWLTQTTVALTNVFNFRPENNDVESLCTNAAGDRIRTAPPLRAGKYIRAEYQSELDRLAGEIANLSPNIIIALGGTATWALLGDPGISAVRGAVAGTEVGRFRVVHEELPALGVASDIHNEHQQRQNSDNVLVRQTEELARPFKVLPTYHPAAVLRDWSLRLVTIMDLGKAAREAAYPEIRRPARTIYLEPTLQDLEWYWNEHLKSSPLISCDIETQGTTITCVGFASSAGSAIVVPFRDNRSPTRSYWNRAEDEVAAWQWVKHVCECGIPLLFQNGAYDSHFLWKAAGIRAVVNEDTMLLHHSLYIEAKKGLGYLGACYTNESSWKLLNAEAKSRKKDD